ncbi:AraC family transcriptional regulator [Pseudoduganella sp. RAF53_2]|uniref:AraC family transcriptional regulator n=1 Tax=unclassified Pseudoduganella TaxID=2637179 RepID=UPI003F9A2A97
MEDAATALRRARMVQLVEQLTPNEGMNQHPAMPGVRFVRASTPVARHPVMVEPSIGILVQGRKRGYLADSSFFYDAQQFLVLALPLPFEVETEASAAEPLLGMNIPVDLQTTAEVAMALDEANVPIAAAPQGIVASPMDDKMSNAVLRFLEAMASPVEARLLGPGIVREIIYHVLTSRLGGSLRAALTHHSQFGKIGKALRRIHVDFNQPIDVAQLADEAGMSMAAFHASFKAVTMTSPIQYLKTTRLHKARLLMAQNGLSAAAASSRVGYESSSQFSREFKRFFGRTPVEEAREMRALLGQPTEPEAAYVTYQ